MAKYKCESCGKEYEKVGSYNLHKYHCELKSLKKEYEKELICEEGAHEYRLLNPHNEVERKAMDNNYMEVCTRCQELR